MVPGGRESGREEGLLPKEKTLAHLESVVSGILPGATISAVTLRVGNHYGQWATDEAGVYRYFAVHKPKGDAKAEDTKTYFRESPAGPVSSPPGAFRLTEGVERVTLIKACILVYEASKPVQTVSSEGVAIRLQRALESAQAGKRHMYLVEPNYEWARMLRYVSAAGGTLDGAGPSITGTVLSDWPLLSGDRADDADYSVYRTESDPRTGVVVDSSTSEWNIFGKRQVPDFSIEDFAVQDYFQREKTIRVINEKAPFGTSFPFGLTNLDYMQRAQSRG